jgi:hypothetical protein
VRAKLARVVAFAALAAGAACSPSYMEVRPTEPLAAQRGRVRAEVTRLWLTEDARDRGLAEDVDLVVEVRVHNDDARERKISPGSFSCWLELDARHPGETRSLLPGGGAAGAFEGAPPDEGSLLAGVTIPAGQSQLVWAIFHGYRFDDSDRPRRVTLRVPLDDGVLALDLADPARGALRWDAPATRDGISVGIHDVSALAGALHGTLPGVEISYLRRRGPVMWDVGLISAVAVQTKGPLQSVTSSFTAPGLTAHVALPVLSWGAAQEPRQLSVFVGASASALIEMLTPEAQQEISMMKAKVHTYGLLTAEGGLELDLGAFRFAATPFPLTPDRRPLPRWSLRVGYAQSWVDGVTSAGLLESLRFTF